MKNDDPIVKKALHWCNRRRRAQGKEPLADLPMGGRFDGFKCPCGVAAGVYVGYDKWGTRAEVRAVKKKSPYGDLNEIWLPHRLPEAVSNFARKFDDGGFPEYEKP